MRRRVVRCAAGLLLLVAARAHAQGVAPTISIQQPLSQTVNQGADVVFSVTATGTEPLTYYWSFGEQNETLAAGARSFLSLTNVQGTRRGRYSVVVSNAFGTVVSPWTWLEIPVATLPASVTITDAVLNGTVNSRGARTMAHFDYGLTTNYGMSTTPIDMGDFNYPIVAHTAIAGLLGETKYHFRIVAINSTETIYGADQTLVLAAAQEFNFTTFGGPGGFGSSDGRGSGARFHNPQAITVDGFGNAYIGDTYNHTIRKVTPEGQVSTVAGLAGVSGCQDGTGSAARFNSPSGLVIDGAGNLYVADTGNYTVRKITPDRTVSTLAGLPGSPGNSRDNPADGQGSAARFSLPAGLAVDTAGNVYVADEATIRKITPAGVVSTLAGLAGYYGVEDGTGSAARFWRASGVAICNTGVLYVADAAGTIRKMIPSGTNWVVSTAAGLGLQYGSADGTNDSARFSGGLRLTADSAGDLYVADRGNFAIRKISFLGGNSVVTTFAGMAEIYDDESVDGTGSTARFADPADAAVDAGGYLYVVDQSVVRRITPAGEVTTVVSRAGGANPGNQDGPGNVARFGYPIGIAAGAGDNLFVADSAAIRKITPDGVVGTIAGLSDTAGSEDGTNSNARFFGAWGVAADAAGNLYVADSLNHTIRKIVLIDTNWVVSTLAGLAGIWGWTDGTARDARFFYPSALAVDNAGNVYVAERETSTIRKITPQGEVSTFAGLAFNRGSADGIGSDARFNAPQAIAVDRSGIVYVADYFNNAIRKITPNGQVSTLAHLEGPPPILGGSNYIGRFTAPAGLTVDSAGNIFVVDAGSLTIRMITPDGTVSTVAGSLGAIGSDDGIGSAAHFSNPFGVALDSLGRLYVSDLGNNNIRLGIPVPVHLTLQPSDRTSFENDSVVFGIEARSTLPVSYQWRFQQTDLPGATNAILTLNNVTMNQAGDYFAVISTAAGSVTSSIARLEVIPGSPSIAILSQPQGQSVDPGTTVILSVTATGNPAPTYQWRHNGVNIPGAVNSSLTLPVAQPTDGGRYNVIVSSRARAISSDPADVVIFSPSLGLADNFSDRVVATSMSGVGSGSNVRATKEPGETNHFGKIGGKSLWYGWQAPATGIATFSTLGSSFDTLLAVYTGSTLQDLTEIASDDDRSGFANSSAAFKAVAGTLYLIAVDGFAGASGSVVLSWHLDTSVSDLPRFVVHPLSQTVTNGATVSFSVRVSSQSPETYEWFHNCDLISIFDNPTATNATLVVTNVQPANVGSYTVRVNNDANRIVASLPAFLEMGREPDVMSRDKLEELLSLEDGGGASALKAKGSALAALLYIRA